MPSMIKPRTLGVLTKAERQKTGASYIVSAFGMFDLANPTAPRFETEQALWLLAAKAVPKGSTLDMGMPKPAAEVLIGGNARPPQGGRNDVISVEWTVGRLSGKFLVYGQRYWTMTSTGIVSSPPKPIVDLPISPERAFGGPGFAANPRGLGYDALQRMKNGELVELPNLERFDQPLLTPEYTPAPVLCGPIDLNHPRRRRYAGTYDQHWIRHVAPVLPDDVNPRLFLNAPDEQIFDSYLKGGEAYTARGFSESPSDLQGKLPEFRVRAFLARKEKKDRPAELIEIAMRIDTLWLFVGARRGVLIYRGSMPVEDVDAEDLSAVMLAYENSSDNPRSFEHYAEVWQLRRDPKQAHKYVFAENQLAPSLPADVQKKRNDARRALAEERLQRHYDGQNWFQRKTLSDAGIPETLWPAPRKIGDGEFDQDLLDLDMPTPEEIEEGDIDLASLLDGIAAMSKKLHENSDDMMKKGQAVRDSLTAAQDEKAGPEQIDALLASIDQLGGQGIGQQLDRGLGELKLPDLPQTDGMPAKTADLDLSGGWRENMLRALKQPSVDDETEFMAARARFLSLPEGSPLFEAKEALDGLKTKDFPNPDEQTSASASKQQSTSLLPDLESLLQGLEDPAATTKPELKTQAIEQLAKVNEQLLKTLPNLSKDGASPIDALLAAVTQTKHSAENSDTHMADARKMIAKAEDDLATNETQLLKGLADMRRMAPTPVYPLKPMSPHVSERFGELVKAEYQRGMNLKGCDMAGANLRGINLEGADLEGALLEQADLTGAKLAGANLSNAALTGTILEHADLTGVDFTGANLAKCRAQGANFTRTILKGPPPIEADFSNVIFHDASIQKYQIIKCVLDGANFKQAKIVDAQFIQSSLSQSVWDGARIETTMFMDLSLRTSSFLNASVFRCMFLKVMASNSKFDSGRLERVAFIGEVDLTRSSLIETIAVDCTFHEIELAGSTFHAGSFDRATFNKSDMSDCDLSFSSLKGAMFNSAILVRANLTAANLIGAQMRKADLSGARLPGANLYESNLDKAVFTAADMTRVNFGKTYMASNTNAG